MGNETGGWHYLPTGRVGSKISNKVMGTNGVYKADVEFTINGQLKNKSSTFFPDNWSEKKVLESINSAYANKKYFGHSGNPNNDTYRAMFDSIEVEMYIEKSTNKLVSAYPSNNNF